MPEISICLTADSRYLFASFASAVWLRERVAPAEAEVTIFAIDLDAAARGAFAPACEASGIVLVPVPRARIGGAPAMFARLFLAELLPPHISRFLYLDGDTQYRASLAPLLAHRPSSAHFLAVRDPMALAVPGGGRLAARAAAHFASLGLSAEEGGRYFNSGVILADRGGWAPIGHDAWRLAGARPTPPRFADQDVLNIAGRGRHRPLSLVWNFPVYLMNARLAGIVEPRIVHYMSNPKPWHGAFPPWTEAEHAPYEALIRRFPAIAPYRPLMPPHRRLRYHCQQRAKRALETLGWGFGRRHARILAYEQEALLRPGEGG